ncbi:conjugal transfer protein [Leuconostoc mesenteroides]|uniref:conjugal transfer protein n=1 Tax=Leuconostoc mesenteroides TaxID=1245 RepID=UPI0021BE1406|nr:conjugal transfer protein [Leuconostoc mesenteroides]MCT8392056.1 conjugal transfer protein [Leuconostoc mesenteroides]MCV2530867.1 conjugal transfer protein [Leuconostoc mesenteroides]WVI91325.1 conjugal transfer protein [Leuconostoc mesenteroides]
MAEVYNYQKALKQDIVIRKISDEYSLPVGISLKPAIIFFASVVVIYLIFHVPLQAFYHANSDLGKLVYVGAYIGLPTGTVTLSNKVKPDGLGLVQYAISIATFGVKKILSRTVYYHDHVLPNGYFEASHMADTPIIIQKYKSHD